MHANQTKEDKNSISAKRAPVRSGNGPSALSFTNNHPDALVQGALQMGINDSPRVQQHKALQDAITASPRMQPPVQKTANQTGLPDDLKTGVETLSGYSLDDVQVHYNSAKPAQLQAHAYAQGTDIHVAPGQEQHLPHEAWHVVQQKQGRVKPTKQLKGKVNVNDDAGLEKEADTMGSRAHQLLGSTNYEALRLQNTTSATEVTAQRNIVQRIAISGIDVVNDNGYPKWTQNEKTYHITMLATDSMHVTEEYSRHHYHFSVDAGTVKSKRPVKSEVGARFKDHHTLDQLPDQEVASFVKNNITAILGVK